MMTDFLSLTMLIFSSEGVIFLAMTSLLLSEARWSFSSKDSMVGGAAGWLDSSSSFCLMAGEVLGDDVPLTSISKAIG